MTAPCGAAHLCDNLVFQIITQQTDPELQEQVEVSVLTSSELEEPGHSFLSRNWSCFSLSPPWSPLLLALRASATWFLGREDAGHPGEEETAAIPVAVPQGERGRSCQVRQDCSW